MAEPVIVRSHNQMSALVAQKVLGWKWEKSNDERVMKNDKGERVFVKEPNGEICTTENFGYDYSTDMNAAMAIAKKLKICFIWSDYLEKYETWRLEDEGFLAANEVPAMAICLAALRIKDVWIDLQLEEA